METLCIITALPAEAAPIADHRALAWQRAHGLRFAEGDGLALLVGGIGKLAAGVSLARFCQWRGDVDAVLNVGIAGAARPPGSALLAHTLIDAGSGWRYQPHLPPARRLPPLDTVTVMTVDRPSIDYREDTALDMEASGIATAAHAFVGTHAMQCLKVVSDGPDAPMAAIDKARVERLIGDRLDAVDALLDCLHAAGASPDAARLGSVDTVCDGLQRRYRHSQTQAVQLQRRLQRIVALGGELPDAAAIDCRDARDLARLLDERLAGLVLRY